MAHEEGADPWNAQKLGWRFGRDSSALVALRGCLEQDDAFFQIGRCTIVDALLEYSEIRTQRDNLLAALKKTSERLTNYPNRISGWGNTDGRPHTLVEDLNAAIEAAS